MADKKRKISKRAPAGKRVQPKRTVPASGETRTKMLMSNPPIRVRERKVNGRWVEISRQRMPKSSGTRKPVARMGGRADKSPQPGEPPNRRMTVARRRRAQAMRNSRNATDLNRNIQRMQRRRPY